MFDISDSLYKSAQRVRLPNASEKFTWAMTFINRERFTEAVGMLRGVLKLDDKYYKAWFMIALVYNQFGESKDSVNFYLVECLSINPDFEPALKLQKQLNR